MHYFLILSFAFIAHVYATLYGGWNTCPDLDAVQSDIDGMSDQIHALLSLADDDTSIDVVSAECQVTAGVTYRVTLNSQYYSSMVVQYRIDPQHTVQNMQIIDEGYETSQSTSVHSGSDAFSDIIDIVDSLNSAIFSVLSSSNINYTFIDSSSTITPKSVIHHPHGAGTTYVVTVDISPRYSDVIISYYIGPPLLILGVPINNPTNVQLVDAGYVSLCNLDSISATVESIRSRINQLLISNYYATLAQDAWALVLSAKAHLSDNIKKVTMDVGSITNVIVSFNHVADTITNLRIASAGSRRSTANVGSFKTVEDEDELNTIAATLDDIRTDIDTLLGNEGFDTNAQDALEFVSALKQVVAGMKYRVTFNYGANNNLVIQYFVDLPVNDPYQTPTNLQLLNVGTMDLDSTDSTIQPMLFMAQADTMAGSFQPVTDLSTVQTDMVRAQADVNAVLIDQGLLSAEETNAVIVVVSAVSQVVAGTNYQVTINVGSFENVVIQYFVALPSRDPMMYPHQIEVIDEGTPRVIMGSYHEVLNLTLIERHIAKVEAQWREQMNNEGLSVEDEDVLRVISAESQTVAGNNYRVVLNIGDKYQGVIVEYFVALPVYDATQTPQQLSVVDLGCEASASTIMLAGGYTDVDDLSEVQADVAKVDADIRGVMQSEGMLVEENDEIKVVSAQKQVVAGTNYRVTIDVGSYSSIVIQYFVDLPVNDEEQMPKNIQVVGNAGDILADEEENGSKPKVATNTVLLVLAIVLGVFLAVFGVVAVHKARKRSAANTNNSLYAELNVEETPQKNDL